MKSILKKAAFTAIAAASIALVSSSGSAFAATVGGHGSTGHVTSAPISRATPPGIETAPSLNTNAERFAEAGGHIGYGLAEGAAAAFIGAPQAVVDGGKFIITPGAIQTVPQNNPVGFIHN